MRRRSLVCLLFLLALPGTRPAFAQSAWEGRARVSVSGGVQVDTHQISEAYSLTKYVETAPLTVEGEKASVPFFDAGFAVRLAGNLGAGVSVSYLTGTADAALAASIPHPFFYNRPRAITGTVPAVLHAETAVHLNLVYVVASPRLDLALSGGASFFKVQQDFVSDVAYSETYPYDAATFTSATLTRLKESKTGYNAGADITFKLSPKWGIGGLLRYSRADVPFTLNDVDVGTMQAGGLQAGGGLRLFF